MHCSRLIICVLILIYPRCTTSFANVNEHFNVRLGNPCSIELKRTHHSSLRIRSSHFKLEKSQPTFSCFCSKDFEAILSVNKTLARSPIRRLWTFYIAPSSTAAAAVGTLIAIIKERVDVHHQSTFIDLILKMAEFAIILHVFSGLFAFKVAKERNHENPIECGIKGFVSGFIVLADLSVKEK
jgi:hypothetical protein